MHEKMCVSKSRLRSGLGKMKTAMIADYAKFRVDDPTKSDTTAKMILCVDYADNFDIRYGKKYIKIVCNK